jgi:hypothetical protein
MTEMMWVLLSAGTFSPNCLTYLGFVFHMRCLWLKQINQVANETSMQQSCQFLAFAIFN